MFMGLNPDAREARAHVLRQALGKRHGESPTVCWLSWGTHERNCSCPERQAHSALLEAGDFAFQTAHPRLVFLDRVEGPFEPAHPTSQVLLVGFQSGAPRSEQVLASSVFRRWRDRSQNAATWHTHVTSPPAAVVARFPECRT